MVPRFLASVDRLNLTPSSIGSEKSGIFRYLVKSTNSALDGFTPSPLCRPCMRSETVCRNLRTISVVSVSHHFCSVKLQIFSMTFIIKSQSNGDKTPLCGVFPVTDFLTDQSPKHELMILLLLLLSITFMH